MSRAGAVDAQAPPPQPTRTRSRRRSHRRLVAGHGGTGQPIPEMEQFGRLFDKVTTSLKNLEFTRDFLRAMVEYERALSPIVLKFMDKQRKANLRFSVVDTSIQDYWRNTAEYGNQMAEEMDRTVLIPIEQFLAESKARQRELNKDNIKVRKNFVAAQKEHSKQKQECERQWQRLNQAIQNNDDLHKRNRPPKSLRKPQEQCSRAFMRMEDLTRNLNKLERDNHRQCCEMGKILSKSQQFAAVRLKAHCDTAAHRAEVLTAFTEKVTPIVTRKAPSADNILWTWVSYPKNHHTELPCSATDVLQKTRANQRFEVRAQPDYQPSEFLNPPDNAELPPGMKRVGLPAGTPEPQDARQQDTRPQDVPRATRENSSQEQQESVRWRPKKRRARDSQEKTPEPGASSRPPIPSQPPPVVPQEEEKRQAQPAAGADGFGDGDFGDFGDGWGDFDQETPGGPPPAAAAQAAPQKQQQPPQAQKTTSMTDAFEFTPGGDDFGDFGDFGDGFGDFPDAQPAAAAPAAAQPAAQAKPAKKRDASMSNQIAAATVNDFDNFGHDDEFGDFGDDFDDDFGDFGDDEFHTPTASLKRPMSEATIEPSTSMAPTSPGSAFPPSGGFGDDGFDDFGDFGDFEDKFGNTPGGPGDEEQKQKAPTINTHNLAAVPDSQRLDSPDPMAGGTVTFEADSANSTTYDVDGDFQSTTREDENGDPFSNFGGAEQRQPEPEPQPQAAQVDPFSQMAGNGAPAAAVSNPTQATPGGFDDFGDFGDFGDEDGFGSVPVAVASPRTEPQPQVEKSLPEEAPVVAAPKQEVVNPTAMFGETTDTGGFGDFGDFDSSFGDAQPPAPSSSGPVVEDLIAAEPAPVVQPEPESKAQPEEPKPAPDQLPDGMDDLLASFSAGFDGGSAPPASSGNGIDFASLGSFGQGFGTSSPAAATLGASEQKGPEPAPPSEPSQPQAESAPAANPFDMLMGGLGGGGMFGAASPAAAAPSSTEPAQPAAAEPPKEEIQPAPSQAAPAQKTTQSAFDDFGDFGNTPGGDDGFGKDDDWAF